MQTPQTTIVQSSYGKQTSFDFIKSITDDAEITFQKQYPDANWCDLTKDEQLTEIAAMFELSNPTLTRGE